MVTEIRRLGLNRLAALEPPRPVVRYERERPGELVHLDIKKLGKIGRVGHRIHGNRRTRVTGIGWEYTHVALDDHSRLAYAEVLADETAETTAGFLQRAVAWFAAQGITVERLLTDNGPAYRSHHFAHVALALGISQRFTQAYRPQTNGKAERFIRTLLTEWACATAYGRSARRTAALPIYLTHKTFIVVTAPSTTHHQLHACPSRCEQRLCHLHLGRRSFPHAGEAASARCSGRRVTAPADAVGHRSPVGDVETGYGLLLTHHQRVAPRLEIERQRQLGCRRPQGPDAQRDRHPSRRERRVDDQRLPPAREFSRHLRQRLIAKDQYAIAPGACARDIRRPFARHDARPNRGQIAGRQLHHRMVRRAAYRHASMSHPNHRCRLLGIRRHVETGPQHAHRAERRAYLEGARRIGGHLERRTPHQLHFPTITLRRVGQ